MTPTVVLLGALWLFLINQLRLEWTVNPQYSYGWLTPFLALYLFAKRWPLRPAYLSPRHARWAGVLAVALGLAFLPTRLIREATPEWSAVSWVMSFEVVGLTLLALVFMGGWAAARHFAAPVCFIFLAVVWPLQFETALTQMLMRALAREATELLNLAGVAAVADGNLLRLSVGPIGLDDACSGVRSLQSLVMASLFLGELLRLPWIWRGLLLAAGMALAMFFNLLRALLLVAIAVRSGVPEMGRWHDPAGLSIFAVSFLVLCGIARLLWRRAGAPAGASGARVWHPLPAPWLAAFALWFTLTEGVTQAWYRAHERGTPKAQEWSVQWPETQPEFQNLPIAVNVRKLLSYSEGREARWRDADGSAWLVYYFKWNPSRASTISARQHRPEVCLPAGGRFLREERPITTVAVGQIILPFRTYLFEEEGRPLHVFFCLWEMMNSDSAASDTPLIFSRSNRLQRVLSGQRNPGQQSLEVIISDLDSPVAAEAAFRMQMRKLLQSKETP